MTGGFWNWIPWLLRVKHGKKWICSSSTLGIGGFTLGGNNRTFFNNYLFLESREFCQKNRSLKNLYIYIYIYIYIFFSQWIAFKEISLVMYLHIYCLCSWDIIEYNKVLYQNMDRLHAYEIALNTWASWVESRVDPRRTKIFFQGVSPDHDRWVDDRIGFHEYFVFRILYIRFWTSICYWSFSPIFFLFWLVGLLVYHSTVKDGDSH